MVKYAPRKVYIKVSDNYVELSYKDFCRRRQADQSYMDKLFIPVQGCLLEVVREQYADFYKDKERWRYLKKLDTNHNLLSLEGFTDSEGNVIDFVIDETVDVAETVVRAVMVDRLKAALPLLSDSEQTLIQALSVNYISHPRNGGRRCPLNTVWCAALNTSPALAYQSIALLVPRRYRGRSQTRANAGAENKRLTFYYQKMFDIIGIDAKVALERTMRI